MAGYVAPILSPGIKTNPGTVYTATAITSNTPIAPGHAIMITASVAGTVTLTFDNGLTIVVNPAVGDNIYPFAVQFFVAGSATVTAAYNLYAQ